MEDQQQHLDRLRAPQIARQDRRREVNALRITSSAIAHTRAADRYRTDPGHDLALRQMAVAHNALAGTSIFEAPMLGEKISDLGLYGRGQQRACPIP